MQTACMLPKMPGLPRLWEHLLPLRSSLSPGQPWGTGQMRWALGLSHGHSQEGKGKGIRRQFLRLPQPQLWCFSTAVGSLSGAQGRLVLLLQIREIPNAPHSD